MTTNYRSFPWVPVLLAVVLLAGCSKQAKKEGHLTRGDEAFQAGDYDRARIEYLNVLRLESTNLVAVQRLGTIYLESGHLLQAAPMIGRVCQVDPANLDFQVKMAQLLAAAGDFGGARSNALRILPQAATNDDLVLLLAELPGRPEDIQKTRSAFDGVRRQVGEKALYHVVDAIYALRDRDRPKAEASLQKAVNLDPKSAVAHFMAGNLLIGRTNLAAAAQELKLAADLSPLRSARRVRYAEFLLRTQRRDEAVQYLEDLSKRAPDYLPALATQAQWAFAERRLDECKKLTEAILSRYPAHLEARLLRSRIMVSEGNAAKAVEELDGLTKIYGRVPDFRYQLAAAHLLNKDPAKAMASLQAALEVDRDHPESVLLLARIHLGRGQFDDAVRLLEGFLKTRPDVQTAYVLLAMAQRDRGRLDDSLAVYRSYMNNFPKDPDGPYLSGIVLRQQKKPKEARQAFEQALQLDPKHLATVAQLVELDFEAKDAASALRRSEAAAAAMPDKAEPLYLVARVYLANNDRANAELRLRKAIELNPEFHEAYLALAQSYVRAGDPTKALKELDALLDKNPKDSAALMLQAAIHSERGDHRKARDAYETLLQARPDFSPALNNLAYLYAEYMDDPARAYALAQRARTLLPRDPTVADTLGWVHYKRGEYAEALRLLLEAAERLPAQPEIQYHLGMTYYMLAQPGPARAALEQSLAGDSADRPWKAEASKRLAALQTDTGSPTADSVPRLEQAVKENPNDLLALTRLAEAYEHQRAYDKARTACEQILRLNPKSAAANIQLARLNAEQFNNPAEAIRFARRARELAPDDAEVALTLGRLAGEAGDHAWAMNLLQEAARKLGERPDVLLEFAQASYLLGKVEEASQQAQKAMKAAASGPVFDSARQLEGLIQTYRTPAAGAATEPQLKALLAANPNHVPALVAMARLQEQQNRFDDARDLYERVLTRAPQFAPARRQLALIYAERLKDDRKAYEHAVKARESFPTDPLLTKTLGVLVQRRGDYRYAVQLLQEAGRALPKDGEVYYSLGVAQLQLKQTKEGTEALTKALELGPQAAYAADAKRLLSTATPAGR